MLVPVKVFEEIHLSFEFFRRVIEDVVTARVDVSLPNGDEIKVSEVKSLVEFSNTTPALLPERREHERFASTRRG